jgi:hypothetical protein
VYKDDETNIRAALAARRLNPRLRLVIRLYNRKLGERLAQLLDQATPGADPDALDTSTTVLSDADTAAPALAATAVAGTSKVVQADGLLLRAVEHPPPGRGPVPDPGLCTLALLSSTTGNEGAEGSGAQGPRLLPSDREVAAATGRGTIPASPDCCSCLSSSPACWRRSVRSAAPALWAACHAACRDTWCCSDWARSAPGSWPS